MALSGNSIVVGIESPSSCGRERVQPVSESYLALFPARLQDRGLFAFVGQLPCLGRITTGGQGENSRTGLRRAARVGKD